MANAAVDLFRTALRAWATEDLDLATQLATGPRSMDLSYSQLVECLVRLDGPMAAAVAMQTLLAGQALERIGDHAAIIGTRLRYLITGDPNHLASEVRH
jgi:phosphate transport system protein